MATPATGQGTSSHTGVVNAPQVPPLVRLRDCIRNAISDRVLWTIDKWKYASAWGPSLDIAHVAVALQTRLSHKQRYQDVRRDFEKTTSPTFLRIGKPPAQRAFLRWLWASCEDSSWTPTGYRSDAGVCLYLNQAGPSKLPTLPSIPASTIGTYEASTHLMPATLSSQGTDIEFSNLRGVQFKCPVTLVAAALRTLTQTEASSSAVSVDVRLRIEPKDDSLCLYAKRETTASTWDYLSLKVPEYEWVGISRVHVDAARDVLQRLVHQALSPSGVSRAGAPVVDDRTIGDKDHDLEARQRTERDEYLRSIFT